MPNATTIALFSLAGLALAVVPGPAVTYIVTQSIDKGRRAGVVSALGISGGGLVHVAAATAGLSALVASSATAFTVVKLAGAAYLIVVGIRRIVTREPATTEEPREARLRKLFAQGVLVNVLNPKTALFFLAFLPQFVNTHRGPVALQVATLGLIFVVIAAASDCAYALLASVLAGRLRASPRALRAQAWASGGVFVLLGITAAAARRAT